jgi:hypothetical protein
LLKCSKDNLFSNSLSAFWQLKIKQLENADKTLLSCQRYAQYGFSKEPLSTVYLALDDVFDSCVLLF